MHIHKFVALYFTATVNATPFTRIQNVRRDLRIDHFPNSGDPDFDTLPKAFGIIDPSHPNDPKLMGRYLIAEPETSLWFLPEGTTEWVALGGRIPYYATPVAKSCDNQVVYFFTQGWGNELWATYWTESQTESDHWSTPGNVEGGVILSSPDLEASCLDSVVVTATDSHDTKSMEVTIDGGLVSGTWPPSPVDPPPAPSSTVPSSPEPTSSVPSATATSP